MESDDSDLIILKSNGAYFVYQPMSNNQIYTLN